MTSRTSLLPRSHSCKKLSSKSKQKCCSWIVLGLCFASEICLRHVFLVTPPSPQVQRWSSYAGRSAITRTKESIREDHQTWLNLDQKTSSNLCQSHLSFRHLWHLSTTVPLKALPLLVGDLMSSRESKVVGNWPCKAQSDRLSTSGFLKIWWNWAVV